MERVLSISLGESALKGGNRKYFEDKLIKQMAKAIKDIGFEKFYKDQGKIYIEADKAHFDKMTMRLKKVFGLVYISQCIRVEKDIEEIKKAAITLVKEKIDKDQIKTFKVNTNRVDKSYPIKSPELSSKLGGVLLREFKELKVDIHNPQMTVYVDIKQKGYVYIDRIEGVRGLPIGSNGKGLLLLSGGIDSPVAAYMMAKRGLEISCVHYHSYPFTSERALEKVKDLARTLSKYIGKIKIHSVNLLPIQKEINAKCPPEEMTIISRKFMMRIAEKIAKKKGINALITGESLGQVASQTIDGINVTNSSVDIPIFRPLIGFDKIEIIEIAKDIETYETSIIPFDDSCKVFLPKNPLIKPKVKEIEKSEEALDVDRLISEAVENMEIIKID